MDNRRKASGRWMLLELSIGVTLVVIVVCLARRALIPMIGDTTSLQIGPVTLWPGPFVALAALAPALIGLAWMLRIFHGQDDAAPPWRHRDR